MAYTINKQGEIVINGWEKGIAESPYHGISDIKNANIISIPGEVSVGFKTTLVSPASATATVVSANTTDKTVTVTGGNFLQGQGVTFSGGSLPTGLVAGTVYWLSQQSSDVYFVWTDWASSTLANITVTGTGTVATVNMGEPKYFTKLGNPFVGSAYFMVDDLGYVWTDIKGIGVWGYTGNTIGVTSHGNGIIAYVPTNVLATALSYIFVFRDGQIDYATITSNTTITWTYNWKATQVTSNNEIHEAISAPDNVIYFCDGFYVSRWFENTGQNFDPATPATYTFDNTKLLPRNDKATCLAFLGTNLMIGGQKNIIYPWDTTSPTFTSPIAISESYISKMVTVGTNTYIFSGNRGRIYLTNGSQARFLIKIPDHLSGTVEPYFQWGGVTSTKNQIYFSASATTNGGTAITAYGGVWALDLDTNAIRLTNKLTYGTYAGYSSAMIAIISSVAGNNPGGAGLYIGWDNGSNGFGIDQTGSSPYSGGETIIDSDLIPIGTVLVPKTDGVIEFKLAVPLVANESIKLQYRQRFSDSFTDISATNIFNTAGVYSGAYQNVNFENSQWLQIRAVLTSTASSPSYVRLTEILIK